MKITQDLIVFDLEATSSENENGHQENNNIIQIGAIYLKKTENKKYEITDRFNEIIKPNYQKTFEKSPISSNQCFSIVEPP